MEEWDALESVQIRSKNVLSLKFMNDLELHKNVKLFCRWGMMEKLDALENV